MNFRQSNTSCVRYLPFIAVISDIGKTKCIALFAEKMFENHKKLVLNYNYQTKKGNTQSSLKPIFWDS